MQILISGVGSTDPIKGQRDAALLHIARIYRPDKIVLVFSEEMLEKEAYIKQSLESIEGYLPEIVRDEVILQNDEIHLFDKMYDVMGQIVTRYQNDENELLFNLSSGTPQMISALFALNRINDYNTQAIQVATPKQSANHPRPSLTEAEQLAEINSNLDNGDEFQDRSILDQAEKFNLSLTKRYLRSLIQSYDYVAAYELANQRENKKLLSIKKIKALRTELTNLVQVFKTQAVLPDIGDSSFTEEKKKALNYFLLIDVLYKKGSIADVLIKAKSLAEFIIEEKLMVEKAGLIIRQNGLPKLNPDFSDTENIIACIDSEIKKSRQLEYIKERLFSENSTLNLLAYRNILEYYSEHQELIDDIKIVESFNDDRNRVAHGLSEINKIGHKRLENLLKALKGILQDVYSLDEDYFRYYDDKNSELFNLLK